MSDSLPRTSIQDGEVESLSVTSIAKFDPTQRGGCPRKFHYHYVQGKEEPTGKGAERGQETHDAIAKYMIPVGLDQTPVPIPEMPSDKLAKKAIEWFHKNRDWTLSGFEIPFNLMIEGTKILLVGRIDCKHDIEILDWKTTSKAIEELPSAASLIHTVQMPGYAKWLLDLYPKFRAVKLTHVYLSKDYDPYEVTKTFDKEVILERWGEIVDTVKEIKKVVRLDIEKVEPNLKACDAFGGCYYRDICKYGKGMTKMGMLDELKKAKKTLDAPGPDIKHGPTEYAQQVIESVLPPDAPEPEAKKRGRPKKVSESDAQMVKELVETLRPTVFKGKITKVSLGRTLNLGQFEGVRIDLEYQVEEGDHRAAFDYLRNEMRELEGYFKEKK